MNVTSKIIIGKKIHPEIITNLNSTSVVQKIQRRKTVLRTRGIVTTILYRKWRVKARRRSTDTTARVSKDTPEVIQLDMDWIILNVQYVLKLPTSSAVLYATKNGWQIRPTRRSEMARQKSRAKDGEWSSCVWLIACRMTEFPRQVMMENSEFRTDVKIFAMNVSSVSSMLTSKKKQPWWPVAFMIVFMLVAVTGNLIKPPKPFNPILANAICNFFSNHLPRAPKSKSWKIIRLWVCLSGIQLLKRRRCSIYIQMNWSHWKIQPFLNLTYYFSVSFSVFTNASAI